MGPSGWCLHPCQIEDRRPLRAPVDQGIAASGVHDHALAPPDASKIRMNMTAQHQGVRPSSFFEVVRQWPMANVVAPR